MMCACVLRCVVQCSAMQCGVVWCGVWRVVWHGVAVWFYDIVWVCKSGME